MLLYVILPPIKCVEHLYVVTALANAEETMLALDAQAFDVLILDLDLPDISGVVLLKDMRAHYNGNLSKVIIFSNSTDPQLRKTVTELGILSFFEKSSTQYEELLALIDNAMSTPQ